jgi:hypothetical protein
MPHPNGGSSFAASGSGSVIQMRRTGNSIAFGSGTDAIELTLNQDASISTVFRGVEILRHSIDPRSGALWATQAQTKTFVPMPLEIKASQWYGTGNSPTISRFNSVFQRAEALTPTGLFTACGPAQSGGVNLGIAAHPQTAGSKSAKKAFHVTQKSLARLQGATAALLQSPGFTLPAMSTAAIQRASNFRSQLQAFKTSPMTSNRTLGLDETCTRKCYTVNILDSRGDIIASNTDCNTLCIQTASTTQSVAVSSTGNSNNWLQCGLDVAAGVFGAQTFGQIIGPLRTLLTTAAASFTAGMTLSEVASVVAFLAGTQGLVTVFAAILAVIALALLIEALYDIVKTCL